MIGCVFVDTLVGYRANKEKTVAENQGAKVESVKKAQTWGVEVGLLGGGQITLTFESEVSRYAFVKRLAKVGPRVGLTVSVLGDRSKGLMGPGDGDSGCLDFDGYITGYTYLKLV